MDNVNKSFRTVLFGGFNKEDVVNYVENMRNEFFQYKKQVETTIGNLNKKISELENLSADDAKILDSFDAAFDVEELFRQEAESNSNSAQTLTQINEATEHLKHTADAICDCLNEFIDKLSGNSIAVTIETPTPAESASDEGTDTQDAPDIVAQILSSVVGDGEEIKTPQSEAAAEPEKPAKSDSMLDSLLPSAIFADT